MTYNLSRWTLNPTILYLYIVVKILTVIIIMMISMPVLVILGQNYTGCIACCSVLTLCLPLDAASIIIIVIVP